MGFKENIKIRRLELNLTLEEVSNKLGVSKPTLQRYESDFINKYRLLDLYGKHTIDVILEMEFKRKNKQ